MGIFRSSKWVRIPVEEYTGLLRIAQTELVIGNEVTDKVRYTFDELYTDSDGDFFSWQSEGTGKRWALRVERPCSSRNALSKHRQCQDRHCGGEGHPKRCEGSSRAVEISHYVRDKSR